MIEPEVARRFDKAKAAGRRWLLVSYDVFDRLRGDEDGGYYYPAYDDDAGVIAYLEDIRLEDREPGSLYDVCEAVIDLEAADEFSMALCRPPLGWLDERRE